MKYNNINLTSFKSFLDTNQHFELDDLDVGMLELCLQEPDFEANMASNDNPYYQEILRQYRVSLRQKKINAIQSL